MKRFYLILLLFLGSSISAFSQFRLDLVSFEEDPTDLSARTKVKLDENGDPTALLKVQIPILREATISSPLKLGDEEYIPGEIRVHLCDGSRKVTVRHPDFEPFEYFFGKPLKGKCVYKLVLKVPDEYISSGLVSVRINTNVLDAHLFIDGQTYHTRNGEFLLKLKKGEYPYTITTDLKGFGKDGGTIAITDTDLKDVGRRDEYIEIQSDKKSNLHIQGANLANVTIDGKPVGKSKGAISLPQGRHSIEITELGYNKRFVVDLIKENESLDADIRVPVTIVTPSFAEFSIEPLENALKPSVRKFKAGQSVRLLGRYRVTAKAKGYDSHEFEIYASPEMNEIRMSVPMISNAHNLFVGTNKIKQNTEKALKEFHKLIANHDELAMWEYGQILINNGRPLDGKKYIRMAADAGHSQAALYTAVKIVNGNVPEMHKYLTTALNGGEQAAHQVLGDIYSAPSRYNPERAFSEYAKYNTPYSRVRRAQLALQNQDKIKVLFTDIIELLETVEAGDVSYPLAQSLLGEMTYKGIGTPKNVDKALECWSKINPKDLTQEILLIMVANKLESDELYKYLQLIDIKKLNENREITNGITITQLLTRAAQRLDKSHTPLSFNMLNKAYELGDRSLTTLSYLGKYYKEGTVVRKDIPKAKELLTQAINQYNDVRSMRWLGNIYEGEKDIAKAENIYLKAISLNDSIAKGYYATILYNKGKKNYSQAVKLWTEAAEAGHKQSIRNLIKYYEKVVKNPSKAKYWNSKLKKSR